MSDDGFIEITVAPQQQPQRQRSEEISAMSLQQLQAACADAREDADKGRAAKEDEQLRQRDEEIERELVDRKLATELLSQGDDADSVRVVLHAQVNRIARRGDALQATDRKVIASPDEFQTSGAEAVADAPRPELLALLQQIGDELA